LFYCIVRILRSVMACVNYMVGDFKKENVRAVYNKNISIIWMEPKPNSIHHH
jgi:hypothetical protein